MQHSNAWGTSLGALSPWQKNYLFTNLLFFTSGENEEATSPSLAIRYVAIEAFSTSLEALIVALLPAGGTTKETTFPTTIKLLIGVKSLFSHTNGEQATPQS